jgi:proteasome lid subunit RPN8/RPN11
LSHDEIVFDDVKYREPERRCRLDRDRRWASLAYEVPGPIDLPIFLERLTADAIERHALRDTSVELGGILLGKECIDEETGLPFVMVTKSLEAKHYENTQASFTYTHDSWEEITRERDRLHPDLDIVGWYHTHPDFGIFLSSHDLFIHRHFFAQPLQVAYVVDPVRQTRGFFQWRDGDLQQVGGFFVYADRGDRNALARLVNDLENIPNTEGGGGLSPRLEAELINMLSRPSPSYTSAADRTQTAAFFSLIGAFAGIFVFAAALWLNALNNRIQDQSLALKDLEKATADAAKRQNLVLDTFLQGREESPDQFLKKYSEVTRERDQFQTEVDRGKTANAALSDRARALEAKVKSLDKDLAEAQKLEDSYKQARKDNNDLPSRIPDLVRSFEERGKKIEELNVLLDNTPGEKVRELFKKYDRAWYAAAVGWVIAILLGLGMLAFLTPPKETTEPESGPVAGTPPTHRIT